MTFILDMPFFKKIMLLGFSLLMNYSGFSIENQVSLSVLKAFNSSSNMLKSDESESINITFKPFNENEIKPCGVNFKNYYEYFKKNEALTKGHFNWRKTKAPFIIQSIESFQLPTQLAVLPLLISGGASNYQSAFGGLGIWGLHYPVAIKHGLILNKNTDERCLDSMASIAAAKQLKHLFSQYDNINYVVLAYLASPTLLNKAIIRTNNASLDSILIEMGGDYAEWLKAFHALAHIDNLISNDYGIAIGKQSKKTTYELSLIKPLIYEAIKDKIDFNFNQFNALNPQNRKQEMPGNYPLKFDSANYFNLIENLDSIYYYQDSVLLNPFFRDAKQLTEMLIYEVRSGDYLGKIAALYAVTVTEIQSWNDLSSSRINVGQELIIYSEDLDTLSYLFYKVKKGDTLSSIAAKFPGITAASIKAKNPNKPIKPGQLLKIKKK